ncbi:SUKH-4 family immunity protein [Actinokineospora sp.]|uniref:SUKH-4 family immunity protein n=1 Tax=Actinokineospora sp. TaxID=1872133 RepID=UPI004037B30D
MITDEMIDAELAALWPVTPRKIPFAGTWVVGPYPDRDVDRRTVAVLAYGPGIAAMGVDRATGEVLRLDDDGVNVVNSSLAALVASSGVYGAAVREAGRLDDDNDLAAIGDRTWAAIGQIDADAGPFWSVAAGELGYDLPE